MPPSTMSHRATSALVDKIKRTNYTTKVLSETVRVCPHLEPKVSTLLRNIDVESSHTIFTSTLTLLAAVVADMKNLQASNNTTAKSLAQMTGYAMCGDLTKLYLDGFKSHIRRGWGSMDWGEFLMDWIDQGGYESDGICSNLVKDAILKYWECREETPLAQVEKGNIVTIIHDAQPPTAIEIDTDVVGEDAEPSSVDDNDFHPSNRRTSNDSMASVEKASYRNPPESAWYQSDCLKLPWTSRD